MAQTTDKNKSNEIGDNISDISNRDSVQSVGASTSIAPDSGEGTVTGDTTISNEINKENFHVESNDTDTDNLNKTECTKVSDVLDDSEDIELQWDEDDCNNTTVDTDTHKTDDELENKLLEETEQNNQDSLTKLVKETKLTLEDKLLQELITSAENCENREQKTTEVPMELNEDELLQEEQLKDSEVMNVDTSDKDSKKQEEYLKENTLDVSIVTQEENKFTKIIEKLNSDDDSQHDLSMEVDDDASVEDSTLQKKNGYGLNQPDVMIEIPTQETIDINDFPDSPIDDGIDDSMEKMHNMSEEEVAAPSVEKPKPSTSTVIPKMTPDTCNESQEVTDCLGLLSESFRVMDEDEDQDDDDGDADDDDDDFDQDESSNQMTAEHSEDSSAQHSENEPARGGVEREEENFAFDEVDIDEDGINGELRRDFKQEIECNDSENRMPLISGLKHARKTFEIKKEKSENDRSTSVTKEKDGTSKPQDNIKKEKDDNILSTCVQKENVSTSVSQGNLEMAVEDNVISTCVTEDKESTRKSQGNVMKEKEDSIISTCVTKEKDGTSISQNNVMDKNEDNITSTCVTKKKGTITVSQDNMNNKNEEAIPSKEATEKSQGDTIHSENNAIQLESAVQSIDQVNKEKEDGTPFGVKIKIEKEDSTKPRSTIVATQIETKYIETQINDDVIEQVIEIETVKISDDEDDEPPKKTQENLQQKTDMTTPLEKPLQGTTALEKNTLVEEVTALEKTTELEKSTETTATSETTAAQETTAVQETTAAPETIAAPETTALPETTAAIEKPLEMEKTTEPDDVTINLTPDQTDTEESHPPDGSTTSPKSPRVKNLTVSTLLNTNIISVVELGESSSEEDIQEVSKENPPEHSISQLQKLLDSSFKPPPLTSMTTVNIPTGIDIMSTSGAGENKTQIVTKEGEVVISGVPKRPPQKTARLNTSEVTIKTASSSEQSLVIPEAKAQEQNIPPAPTRPKLSLEIFSLDSDEEETPAKESEKLKKKTKKCVNSACSSGSTALEAADIATAEYYDAARKKRPLVCQPCADAVLVRKQKLMAGIKNLTPLLKLDSSSSSQDLVEISDSESEGEDSEPQEQQPMDTIGEEAAK
ncbi:unnamed protein product [Arctia plantaginis]|uniref:Uncharacterized protein n=1 Tax=Arctia plantaginis TaxID=874455 RepID=A0A8S1BD34_ARCPL|nr:unnamed protein product [Arctia plantaginis]